MTRSAACRSRLTTPLRDPNFRPMQYLTMTEVSPEEVIERAKLFFAQHARVGIREPEAGTVAFHGDIGTAEFKVYRAHGHTNVRVTTDRVVGLDITDLAKRFLYTLGHV